MASMPIELAEHIVDKIIADLRNRKGLRQEWDLIDKEIQEDIKHTWRSIIEYYGD